jgi:hypothetical protein
MKWYTTNNIKNNIARPTRRRGMNIIDNTDGNTLKTGNGHGNGGGDGWRNLATGRRHEKGGENGDIAIRSKYVSTS